MSELALTLIQKAKAENAEYLDLGNCGLTDWPESLFELTDLKTLVLSNKWWNYKEYIRESSTNSGKPNVLNSIPEEINKLIKLEKLTISGETDEKKQWNIKDLSPLSGLKLLSILDFSQNQVRYLEALKGLTSLKELYLNYNQVTDLEPLSDLISLIILDFSFNQVADLSPLTGLISLKTLAFRSNQVKDLSPLSDLTSLNQLYFDSNQVSDLNPVSNLISLTTLEFSSNKVTNLESLSVMKELNNLDFRSNQVTDLRPLKSLTLMKKLYFSSNRVINLEPLLGMQELNKLDFGYNQVADLRPLKSFVLLSKLFFSYNQVTDLEPLRGLTSLDKLYFSYNQVTDLSPLSGLTLLSYLEFRSNQVSDLSPLSELSLLSYLDFRSNQVSDLGPLTGFTFLSSLYFSFNQVSDLEPLSNLTSLVKLSFSFNQVVDLSPLEGLIKKGIICNWDNNPLARPSPEVARLGKEAILNYFAELRRTNAYHLLETRLLIVGQGGAGKTSLRRKLKDIRAPLPDPNDSTRGIEVDQIELTSSSGKTFTLHIWDFGGQNIQHYAHQFFLTGSSLYVLVHNQREQNTNFQYWLNIIGMLGEGSPVLIVQNEIAGHKDPIEKAHSIRERFPNVIWPFFQVDLSKAGNEDRSRFEQLKKAVELYASDPTKLPHFGKVFPGSFIKVRQAILDAACEEAHYLTWPQFEAICADTGVFKPNLVLEFSRTLSVLGACLHFPEDPELCDFVFLRPKWIIDALFKLLYFPKIEARQGEFSEMDTREIWKGDEYKGMHRNLLRLMENFEMCYEIENSHPKRRYILPQRLPLTDERYPWDEPEAIHVIYRYKFMPKGIITRITCRLHQKIEQGKTGHVWCDAVIFVHKKARAFVRERYAEDEIWIDAAGEQREVLLNRIVEEIDDIHAKSNFNNLRLEKLVPCNCELCRKADEPHYFDFDYLSDLIDDGESSERCQKSRRMVDIRAFLASTGIKRKNSRKIRVFLSYAHEDKAGKEQLIRHLNPMIRQGVLEIWHDREILPGGDWQAELRSALYGSEIILFLVSPGFISSDFIWDEEMVHALERRDAKSAIVIPVIYRPADWTKLEFAKRQALPGDGKPITTYENQDEAFVEVAKGIRSVAERLRENA